MRQGGFIGNGLSDLFYSLVKHRDGLDFIYRHKLWKGFGKYGWLSRALTIIALIVGVKFLLVFINWVQATDLQSAEVVGAGFSDLFQRLLNEGRGLFFLGGLKYVILIFTEVLIFHFMRGTQRILTGEEVDASFKTFWAAEMRMIGVAFRCWIYELIISILLSVALGIVGLGFLQSYGMLIVQCYFVGFAIVDNYFDLRGLKVDESAKAAWQVPGLVLGVGAVAYTLFLFPVIGSIIGPIIAAVTAALLLFEYEVKGILALEEWAKGQD